MSKTDETRFLFEYKKGNSVLYRIPSWIKILCLFICGSAFFFIPYLMCLCLIPAIAAYAFSIGFTLKEQLRTLTPVAYYAVLLYAVSLMGKTFIPQKQDIVLCIRLLIALQTTTLLFATTTPLQLRHGLESIEIAIRKILPVSKQPTFSELFSFFLLFLPMVMGTWHQLNYSWKARGGKNGPRKILVLFPLLLSLCMHKAWVTERAIRNRASFIEE